MTSSGPGRVTKPANIAATFFRSSSASSYWSTRRYLDMELLRQPQLQTA
jgi:hypothetical protein